jgi:RNA polymerase sigma factor (sigma-70 family)
MRRETNITQESFEALLAWLDPNREIAGEKYETIRTGLVRIFRSKGFGDAEDLADLVINRVIERLPDIRENYVGEPVKYFRGVARNVMHEAWRRKEIATDKFPEELGQLRSTSDEYDCLLTCLDLLPREHRELVLDFYVYDKRDRIISHKRISEELGITAGNLRVRVHRIRIELEKCVSNCTKKAIVKQKSGVRPLVSKEPV